MKTKHVKDDGYKTPAEQTAEEVHTLLEAHAEGAAGAVYMRPIQLKVERQYRESGKDVGAPEVAEDLIEVQDFHVPPAEVGVDLGLTLNMGNYESAKIGISVRVPCYTAELPEAYEFAKRFARDRLQAEREAIRTWAAKRRNDNHMF